MGDSSKVCMSLDHLRSTLSALLGDLAVGDSLRGWQLVHIDVDESLAYAFERGKQRIEIALSPRDDTVRRYAQSRSFNIAYSVSRLPGSCLDAEGRELVDAVTRRLVDHDDGTCAARFAVVAEAPPSGEVREIDVDTLLCPTTIGAASYYTANPYVGCLIGCSFCYAQPRVAIIRKLAGYPAIPWGRYVLAKRNAAAVLARELASQPRRPIVLSPLVSDVYQSIERRLGITRACLEVIARAEVQVFVLTRSTLVTRDIDLFGRIPGATVGFSIPTDRDDVARAYEPRAAPVSERLRALGELRCAGVRTVAVLQPLLPMNVEALVDRLAEVCEAIRVDVYRPPALGGAPLVRRLPTVPEVDPDQDALRARVLEAVHRRGLQVWTSHVPL